jgi:hypothetical protein
LPVGSQAFDGDNVRAVELEEKLDARIDRKVLESRVEGRGSRAGRVFSGSRLSTLGARPSYQHGAGAAVAFAADDFRPDEPQSQAEKVREREKRVAAADGVAGAVDIEHEVVAHEGPLVS